MNAADQSTGMVGDIECTGIDGELKLAVEVKDRDLTLSDVRSALLKARKVSLGEALLNVPDTLAVDREQIDDVIKTGWASGTNLYRLTIDELIKVGLFLTGEPGRRDFLVNIGEQLDAYSTQPINRKRWKELLEGL